METARPRTQARQEGKGMSTAPASSKPASSKNVAYVNAARRHLADAETLFTQGREANAGQLYGFTAECGLKAMLLACGVPEDSDGGIPRDKKATTFRLHMPELTGRIASHGRLIPDGKAATRYMAMVPDLMNFQGWIIDHRYWHDRVQPLGNVPQWRLAAQQVGVMLDELNLDGILPP
jgi:hypothetical protein